MNEGKGYIRADLPEYNIVKSLKHYCIMYLIKI